MTSGAFTHYGSLLLFPHHCGMEDFRILNSISYTVTANKVGLMNPEHFGTHPDTNPD